MQGNILDRDPPDRRIHRSDILVQIRPDVDHSIGFPEHHLLKCFESTDEKRCIAKIEIPQLL